MPRSLHDLRSAATSVVAAGIVVTMLAGCSAGGDEAASPSPAPSPVATSPSPTPTPTPPPTPPPAPVEGELTVTRVVAARPERLGTGQRVPSDRDRVEAVGSAIAEALDRHLTALQAGEDDLAGLGAAWADEPAVLASLTTALGTPDNLIASAAYDVAVQWEDQPTVAVAAVRITREDATATAIDLVFDVTGDGPTLVLLGDGGTADGSDS